MDSAAVHLSENAVGYPFRPLSGGHYNKCFPAMRDCVICTKIKKQMAKRNASLSANCKNFSVLFVFATHTLLVQTQVYEKGVYSQWQATRVLCPRLRKP